MASLFIKKSVSLFVMLGVAAACLLCFASCGGKQVPVYQGMEISNKKLTAAHQFPEGVFAVEDEFSDGVTGDIGKDGEELPVNPFPENPEGKNIESEAASSLTVIGSEEEMYYTRQFNDIYVNIKISNPDKYEILSFTFNGEKYSDYMFEEGSDLENIIIKVNSEDNAGIVEYTIDAMKYIDENNAIKDVIMAGEKTVKVGVRTLGQVGGEVENVTVNTNSISCYAVAYDPYGLIEYFEGKAFAVVYDGDSIVGYQELPIPKDESGITVGMPQGEVNITGLKAGRVYQFGIVAFYDELDGEGFGPKVVYKQSFKTDSILTFSSVLVGKERVDFGFKWDDAVSDREIVSLSLYRGDNKIADLQSGKSYADGLLSGIKYRLVAVYRNAGANESIYAEFTTEAKAAPNITDTKIDLVSDALSVEYGCQDTDGTLISVTGELFRGQTLIAEGKNGRLNAANLGEYTEYVLKITFVYDLNDGEGQKTYKIERKLKTSPYFDITSLRILNTDPLFAGETVYMQAEIDNPNSLDVTFVTVNGVLCPAEYNAGKVYFELNTDKNSPEGMTEFEVERVSLERHDEEFFAAPSAKLAESLYVNLRPTLEEVSFSDINGNILEYAFAEDEIYLLLEFSNITDYLITGVYINSGLLGNSLTSLGNGKFIIPIELGDGWSSVNLTGVEFGNSRITSRLSGLNVQSDSIYVANGGVNYVSTAEDLLSMAENSQGKYYELTENIDLSETVWKLHSFNGVLNGKGYTVSGLTLVKTYRNENASVGLFSSLGGVVTNLNISGFYIKVGVTSDGGNYHAYGGVLTGSVDGKATVSNCSVSADCSVEVSNSTYGDCFAGGIVGTSNSPGGEIAIKNCHSEASVTSKDGAAGGLLGVVSYSNYSVLSSSNYGEVKGIIAGGIIAYRNDYYGIKADLAKCENRGKITATENAGGIIAKSSLPVLVENCINRGEISGANGVGGIIGSGNSSVEIFGCRNYGKILGNENVGGIIGSGNSSVEIFGCRNYGKILGNKNVGGIAGEIKGVLSGTEMSTLINSGVVEGTACVGGIVGYIEVPYSNNLVLCNAENLGKVSGSTSVGGIIGFLTSYGSVNISKCVNSANILCLSQQGGGIIGCAVNYEEVTLSSLVNFAEVKNADNFMAEYLGGIVGKFDNYKSVEVTNCVGAGVVEGLFSKSLIGQIVTHVGAQTDIKEDISDNLDKYDVILETKTYYSEKLGFKETLWNLDGINTSEGKYPTMAAE